MKKLVLFFALAAFAAVEAKAQAPQQVDLESFSFPLETVTTVPGESYVVTPVSGAWKEFRIGISGCDGGGANCANGFEFSYNLGNFTTTTFLSGKFATEAQAFAAAPTIDFTAVNASTSFSIPCLPCSSAVGTIRLDISLGSLSSPGPPGISDGFGPEITFVSADNLVQLSVPDLTPYGDGGFELAGTDFNSVFAVVSGAGGGLIEIADSLFQTTAFDYEQLAQNEDLSAEEVILNYSDFQAANAAFSETAQALTAIFEDDRNPYQMVNDAVQALQSKYYEKGFEFDKTETGTALGARFFDPEYYRNAEPGEVTLDVEAYHAAKQAYAPDEYKAMTEAQEFRSLIYDRVYGARDRAADAARRSAALNPDPGQSLADSNFDLLIGVLEALGDADQFIMDEQLDHVVQELEGITVLAQSGPVKTYAAADGPATIVTAFADTRK